MKIPTPIALVVIAVAVLTAAGIGFNAYQKAQVASGASQVEDVSRPYHTEEEWTVLQITQFIADMGALTTDSPAKDGTIEISKQPTEGKAGLYRVQARGEEVAVSVAEGVWNPAVYKPWAGLFFRKADDAPVPTGSEELAKTLLGASFDTFFAENRRISDFLTAHPASGPGHVQAALLLGTIGLHDHAGKFRDVRIPLNRMVAHLAAADVLGVPADDAGRQLAEAIRLTLCGQQADAVQKISSLPSGAVFGEWAALLKLRNTLDWRGGKEAALAGGTALQAEYFRALLRAVTPNAAVDFLRESGKDPDITFWRIANELPLSVSNGHLFSKPMLGVEIDEVGKAANAFGVPPAEDSLDWLKEYLDTPEGSPVVTGADGPGIEVAGRNLFAGYHQRHLMQAGQRLFYFLNDAWGVGAEARKAKEFLTGTLPELRYKPFLVRMLARNDAESQEANVRCAEIIRANPEMVTPFMWSRLSRDNRGAAVFSAPDFHPWFNPEVPQMTACETEERLFLIGVGNEDDKVWLETLHRRAPYAYMLAFHNIALHNNGSNSDIPTEVAGPWLAPLVDYHIDAIACLARTHAAEPDLYEEHMKRAAELDPDRYLALGAYFRDRGMDAKAAHYMLKAFEEARDRVHMANEALWLVQYLFNNNDPATARRVAEDAAEVYSYDGLASFQWLMEAEGNWNQALETARKIDERYNDDKPLVQLACLIRMKAAAPDVPAVARYQAKLDAIFPDGLQRAALEDFAGPPQRGVILAGLSNSMKSLGLTRNILVVGLDGYRTDNQDQYMIVRALTNDPQMNLIVWDGANYRLVEGKVEGRRFGVGLEDYVAN